MSKRKLLTPLQIECEFQKRGLPKNFCIVPFTNLILNPDGRVGICRQKGTEHVIGHIDNDDPQDLFNNDYMVSWRREFFQGDIKICQEEMKCSACHLSPDNYVDLEALDIVAQRMSHFHKLTANLNGKCNLQCRMCHVWQMPNGIYDNNNFWQRGRENYFKSIKEIELLSGEPFIQEDTFRLIDEVTSVNPDCSWSFTTNGQWKFDNRIREYLDRIDIKNIILSLDSLDPVLYPQIRRSGVLQRVLETIEDLLEYRTHRISKGQSGLGLTIHFLVMRDNWKEIPDIIDFTIARNMRLTIDPLYTPPRYSLKGICPTEQVEVVNYLLESLKGERLVKCMKFINWLSTDFPQIDKAMIFTTIKEQTVLLD